MVGVPDEVVFDDFDHVAPGVGWLSSITLADNDVSAMISPVVSVGNGSR